MSSSADEEALGKFATDQFREDQKYCAKIGLKPTEARIRSLEKRIESVHSKGKTRPDESPEVAAVRDAIADQKHGFRTVEEWTSKLSASLRPLVLSNAKLMNTLSEFGWTGTEFPRPPNLIDLLRRLEEGKKDAEESMLQKEKEEAKRFLNYRVQGYRTELCEGWGQHRVMLQQRPTPEEKRKGIGEYRRPHQRVVVQRDEEQIHTMIDDCVSKSVKKSLRKMRQNLFQRRINLAIHDRLINEWTLPKIKSELRRRGGRGEDQHKAPRLTVAEAGPEVVAGGDEVLK